MRGVVRHVQFSVADRKARVTVVAGTGQEGQEVEMAVLFEESDPGPTVHAATGEDASVRKVNEVRPSERRAAVRERPVGKWGFGGPEVRAAVVRLTTHEDLHLAGRSKPDGRFVRAARHVELRHVLEVDAVGRLDEENFPVRADRLVDHAVADAVMPRYAPEPVHIGADRRVDLQVLRRGEILAVLIGEGDLNDAPDQFLIDVNAPAHQDHQPAVGHFAELGVAQVERVTLEQGDRLPLLAVGAAQHTDHAVSVAGLLAGDVPDGGLTERAVEFPLELNDVGKRAVLRAVPDHPGRKPAGRLLAPNR